MVGKSPAPIHCKKEKQPYTTYTSKKRLWIVGRRNQNVEVVLFGDDVIGINKQCHTHE